MKHIKPLIAAGLIALTSSQSFAERNPHLYVKGDFSSQNIITEALTLGATALINRSTNDFLWDNIWNMAAVYGNIDGQGLSSDFGFAGIKPYQLFCNFGTGVKVGYQTDNIGFFNVKGYGSLHYRTNNQKICLPWETEGEVSSIHRLQIGAGGIVVLGAIHHSVRVAIEAGLRLNVPIYYSGPFGDGPSCLNTGVAPVLGVTVAGRELMKKCGMNIGLFFELPGYNIFKESDIFTRPYSVKTLNIGLNLTICPWKRS